MVILIDIGNTNVHIGIAENRKIVENRMFSADVKRTKDEWYLMLKGFSVDTFPEAVVISSVVPYLTNTFVSLFKGITGKEPIIIHTGMQTGMEIHAKDISYLPPDRFSNVIGAFYEYRKEIAVIDFGTATKVDIVDSKGIYLGGIVAPGIYTSYKALIENSSLLPNTSISPPKDFIAKDSQDSLKAGILLNTIGFLEATKAIIRKEIKKEFLFVATGGASHLVYYLGKSIDTIDRDLTLKGMLYLYDINRR